MKSFSLIAERIRSEPFMLTGWRETTGGFEVDQPRQIEVKAFSAYFNPLAVM